MQVLEHKKKERVETINFYTFQPVSNDDGLVQKRNTKFQIHVMKQRTELNDPRTEPRYTTTVTTHCIGTAKVWKTLCMYIGLCTMIASATVAAQHAFYLQCCGAALEAVSLCAVCLCTMNRSEKTPLNLFR